MKEYTITYLNEKCDKMFACLQNSKVDMQNEQEILNRCEILNRMIAESGEYKAVAQYKVDDVTQGEIGKAIARIADARITASTLNTYVKSAAKDWNYLVNSFDRINSAAGKQIMNMNVLISYEKTKMNLL